MSLTLKQTLNSIFLAKKQDFCILTLISHLLHTVYLPSIFTGVRTEICLLTILKISLSYLLLVKSYASISMLTLNFHLGFSIISLDVVNLKISNKFHSIGKLPAHIISKNQHSYPETFTFIQLLLSKGRNVTKWLLFLNTLSF